MKTKKKKIVNYLKQGILLFSISLLLWNCEKEEDLPIELNKEKVSKSISFSTLENTDVYQYFNTKHKLGLITDKNLKHFQKGTETVNEITIITQKINQVIKNGAETYSMLIEYDKKEENTYYNLILHKKSGVYRMYTLKIEHLKKLHGKGTSVSEEVGVSVKAGIIPYDGWDDGDYGDDSTGGGDYVYQCRDIIVKVDALCTGGGHTEYDSSCKCQVTDFNCYKGYSTLKTEEFCEYVWVGDGNDPNNTGNTGTGNTGNGGETNTELAPIETDVVSPKDLLPEGALQTIINCLTNLTNEQVKWLNAQQINNSANLVNIWSFINQTNCSIEAKSFAEEAINFLKENPQYSFEEYENWFSMINAELETNPTVVNPDDITFESTLTQQVLPTFSTFLTNFPKRGTSGNYSAMSTTDAYTLAGGSILYSHINQKAQYNNACAIRASRGLLYSGIQIPVLKYNGSQRTQKGGDQKNYILDAVSFNTYMIAKFGETSLKLEGADANDPVKVAAFLKGKKGVYVIINSNTKTAGYSGHCDVIINGKCISNAYTTPKGGVKSIRVWKLN